MQNYLFRFDQTQTLNSLEQNFLDLDDSIFSTP